MSLHTIVYSSREVRPMSDADKQQLLEKAREFNRAHGITGMLLYFDMVFFQVLEGPRVALEQLYERICKDVRHQDVTTHVSEAVDERLFPEWSMAYRAADGRSVRSAKALTDLFGADSAFANAEPVWGQQKKLMTLIGTVAKSMDKETVVH